MVKRRDVGTPFRGTSFHGDAINVLPIRAFRAIPSREVIQGDVLYGRPSRNGAFLNDVPRNGVPSHNVYLYGVPLRDVALKDFFLN